MSASRRSAAESFAGATRRARPSWSIGLRKYTSLGKRFEPSPLLVDMAKTEQAVLSATCRLQSRLGEHDMRHAVVIDAVRTPIGKASSDKGIYRDVRAEELSAHVIDAARQADGHRSAPDRRRALGLRAAAGGAGVRRRADRSR